MKKKDIQELATKDSKELLEAVKVAREEVASLVIDHAQNKLKNTSLIAAKKKTIAIMLTKIREKEIQNGKSA